ncbi:hypothetical protein DFJ43DRAFT_727976 [Lentinula guzmanii]|uniref:Uncharacterized protein n=1 Tax=Lentinula guzmanii TaxID=2804957 RepID=A0AA38JBC2_9AGAR|nr:hypothetical protein DFJ43DRAFT_727976 [Lentinula guzmanii]
MRLFPSSKDLSLTTSFVLTLGLVSVMYTTAMPTPHSDSALSKNPENSDKKLKVSFPESNKLTEIKITEDRMKGFVELVQDSILEGYTGTHFTQDKAFDHHRLECGEATPRLYKVNPEQYQIPFSLATEQGNIKGWISFWRDSYGHIPGPYANVKWQGRNDKVKLDVHYCYDLWGLIKS